MILSDGVGSNTHTYTHGGLVVRTSDWQVQFPAIKLLRDISVIDNLNLTISHISRDHGHEHKRYF